MDKLKHKPLLSVHQTVHCVIISTMVARKPKTRTRHTNGNPTSTDIECLRAWKRLCKELGREPTMRELSKALGHADNGAAHTLRRIERKGGMARQMVEVPGPRVITSLGEQWLKTMP